MSNQYNTSHWSQNPMHYSSVPLEDGYQYTHITASNTDRQQQILSDQPPYGPDPAYQYGQQQIPSSAADPSIHNTYAPPINNQPQQRVVPSQSAQSSMNATYAQGAFNPPQMIPSGTDGMTSYRHNAIFNIPNTGAGMSRVQANGGQPTLPPTFLGAPITRESYPQPTAQQQDYYQMETDPSISALPQAKRARGPSYKEDQEDAEGDINQDQKDANKNKLARACARCKTLKVRCEAKTETEPCKRCFNGGHECVIPGRKIRRTPPKREFLLSQIQSQAAEIERLMMQLERMNAAAGSPQVNSLHETTSPGATPRTVYTELQSLSIDDGYNGANGNNAAVNKAVEDWIAKARESLHEFGTFIGIGGAGMPKSYLVDDSDSSDEEEFVDVQEELDESLLGSAKDSYGFSVKDPSGAGALHQENSMPGTQNLRHQSSNSSIGTVGTAGANPMPRPKKLGNDYLEKPANLPGGASPFGLFGRLGLQPGPSSRAASAEPEEDAGPGIANEDFFKSTPAPNALGRRLESATHQAPAILTRGIVTPQEAENLFKIYFDNMNLSVSLLDPVLYTAQRTFYRSPFLFTVICAIASRFYTERPDLYSKIMHHAQLAAGNALITGNKNVEMCQAYILLSLYPVPAKKWEDQRNWLYLGLAIRTATDINLHLPTTAKPVNENHAREMLNRTRVWLNCFNVDRSTGSQYGKPPIISSADYIANHCQDWWESSPYSMEHFDIHLCAYNAELKVMSAFIAKINSNPDHPTGLNKDVEFERIATETDDQLKNLMEFWFEKIYKTDMSDPQNNFRTGLLRLAYSYSRLVALSYGFQHAFGKRDVDENPFLMRCLKAASDVVEAVINDICRPSQIHYFRHGPEAQSVFVTFASAFLVKLLQPKFAAYLTQETRGEIRSLVQKVIDLLGSPEVAIDDRHGPKLYSRFLEKLLAKPMARLDQPATRTDAMSPASTSSGLPRQQRVRPQKPSVNNGTPEYSMGPFDAQTYNQTSPATHSSLSPPPTESALSFEQFAPTGPTDPFALDSAAASIAASNSVDVGNMNNVMNGEFFQPPLPFDNRIVQSLQSLTDPSGWQDISLPGFDWMAQFQRNLGLDISNLGPDINAMYDQNMNYMTGTSNGN